MFVEKVENGYAYITEANYDGKGSYHQDVIQLSTGRRNRGNGGSISITGYIHLGGVPAAELRVERKFYNPGDTVTFFFGGQNTSGTYTLGIYKSFDRYKTVDITGDWYSIQLDEVESYSAYMTAYSASGNGSLADSNWVDWQVLPLTAEIKADKSTCIVNDSVILDFGGNNNHTFADGCITLGVWRNGERIVSENVYDDKYIVNCTEPGEYSAYMTAYGGGTYQDSNLVEWTVYPLTVELQVDKQHCKSGETVLLSFGGYNNGTLLNGNITLGVWRDETRIVNENIRNTTYSLQCAESGNYSAYITVYGGGTYVDSEYVYWTVSPSDHFNSLNIQAVTIFDGNIIVDVQNSDGICGMLFVASYKPDGRFISVAVAEISDTGQVEVTMDTSDAGSVSVFILDNLFRPVCRKFERAV